MYTYKLKSQYVDTPVTWSEDTIRGFYSGQLLASIASYIGNSDTDVAIIGGSVPIKQSEFGVYGFSLTRDGEKESIIETITRPPYQLPQGARFEPINYVNPNDYSVAYSQALHDAIVFRSVVADMFSVKWNKTKTLYHTVLNFDKGNTDILFLDAFDADLPFDPNGGQANYKDPAVSNWIFSETGDNELSTYYVGLTSDARNTPMVKLGTPTGDGQDWFTGLCAFFKLVVQGGQVLNNRTRTPLEKKPELYMYVYNTPVALVNAKDPSTMISQLPSSIYRLEY